MQQAVILCGGLGTRLGELTRATPKPLLPVRGRPFLEILIQELTGKGITDFLLLAAFEAEQIREFATGLGARLGMDLRCEVVVEPERVGTGGALRYAAEQQLLAPRFFLLNGDSWFDVPLVPLRALLDRHETALCALALRAVEDAGRYGQVAIEGDTIADFGEKRQAGGPGLINGGVYAMRREAAFLCAMPSSLEADLFPTLVREKLLVGAELRGYFLDIGIPSDYERAQDEIAGHRLRGAVFFDRDGVLNVDHGHVGTIDRFEWRPGAMDAIRRVNQSGRRCFIVTNQAGIGKGLYTEQDYRTLRRHMRTDLAAIGAWIDDERFCPDHPDASIERYRRLSDWRKPGPGMILNLLKHWPTETGRSFLIGDKPSDVEAAEAAGLRGHLVTEEPLDLMVARLLAA